MQVTDSRRAAHPIALGDLIPADAILLGAVEVVIGRQPGLHPGLDERLTGAVPGAVVDHPEGSAGAVKLADPPLVVLGTDEVRQHAVPAPTLVTQRRPAVVIEP